MAKSYDDLCRWILSLHKKISIRFHKKAFHPVCFKGVYLVVPVTQKHHENVTVNGKGVITFTHESQP